jgi:hypothetical protein
MNLWMDPLGDPLTTRPILTGWELTMEPYPSGQFGFIDDPDRQIGNGSVWTWTRTRSDGPEPLLTLVMNASIGPRADVYGPTMDDYRLAIAQGSTGSLL